VLILCVINLEELPWVGGSQRVNFGCWLKHGIVKPSTSVLVAVTELRIRCLVYGIFPFSSFSSIHVCVLYYHCFT